VSTIDPRARRSERLNKARVKLELRRSRRPLVVVGIFTVLALVLSLYIVRHVSQTALRETYEARFALTDATGIKPGLHEVRFKGIPVGTITETDFAGGRPVITARIRSSFGRLGRDVRAVLRPNTALQDMFLDIVDRGTPARGELRTDETVPAGQVSIPVRVDEVLNMFGTNERARLRELLDGLGNGMADKGDRLRSIFVEAVPLLEVAGRISGRLADRAPRVRRLVRNAALLTHELGDREGQLRTLVREGSATLSTVQTGRDDLDATLRELPPTLDEMRRSFAAVRGSLGDVDSAVRSLHPVADRLPVALRSLRRFSAAAQPALEALDRPVERLQPLVRTLPPLTGHLDSAARRLLPQADTIDKVTDRTAGCKKGIQGFFQWNASIAKFGDARHGNVPRGNLILGLQGSSVLNDPQEYAPKACTPGQPITGRVPTRKDMH